MSGGLTASSFVPRLLLTPEEAAQSLGIGRTKVFELLRAHQLPSVLVGGSRRIRTSDLIAFTEGLLSEESVVNVRPTHPAPA